jgi:ATP-binding cassette subfamily B protein
MNDLRKFARYFLPYKVSLIIGILCILAGVIVNQTIPLIVGHAIDEMRLWSQISWYQLTLLALQVLGASIISNTFLFLQRRLLIGMSRHVEYDL